MSFEKLDIDKIRVDGGTQTRARTDPDTVTKYAEEIAAGATRPDEDPVVVFHDGKSYWLASGFHWVAALRKARAKVVRAKVLKGGIREAVAYGAACNATHGLPLSREDKRHKVRMYLEDKEWAAKSDSWIAAACKVSDHLVADVRKEAGNTTSNSRSRTREGRDGRRRPASRPRASKPARNGAVTFDWKRFTSDFNSLYRQVDALGNACHCKESPEIEGLRRLLVEWRRQFKAVSKSRGGSKPPEE